MIARMGYPGDTPMSGPVKTLIWCGMVMVAVFVLGALVLLARRAYVKSLAARPEREGFTPEAIEKLRDAGQITREEFIRLRRAALGIAAPAGEKAESESRTDAKVDDEKHDSQRG